jgi:hypothetical protein
LEVSRTIDAALVTLGAERVRSLTLPLGYLNSA